MWELCHTAPPSLKAVNLRLFFLLLQVPFVALLLLSGILLSRAVDANTQATQYAEQAHEEIAEVNALLGLVLNMETGLRGYVITGEDAFLEPYHAAQARLPQAIRSLEERAARLSESERAERETHLNNFERLVERWTNDVARPEIDLRRVSKEQAEAVVASGRGKALVDRMRAETAAYTEAAQASLQAREALAARRFQILRTTLLLAGLAVLLGSALVAWWGADWLSRQLGAVGAAAGRLARGEQAQLPKSSLAEQRRLAAAFNSMSHQLEEARGQTQSHLHELEVQERSLRQLGELSDLLLAARSLEEGAQVASLALPALLPESSGELLLFAPSRNILQPLAAWGTAPGRTMPHDTCWALRHGDTLWPDERSFAAPCQGAELGGCPYICLPLTAHGETLGLLRTTVQTQMSSADRTALQGLARQLALSLDALLLQDRLRQQSIRDALTGLYNRRYYEDYLSASLGRASSDGTPLTLVALDVDHFKRFNDTFGHDAGDAVLVQVGAALKAAVQPPYEAACRPGGEEFALILPGTDAATALQRAEALRQTVEGWTLTHAGTPLGQLTVSIGVAEIGSSSAAELTRHADEALYAAKRGGRNQVVIWQPDLGDVMENANTLVHS